MDEKLIMERAQKVVEGTQDLPDVERLAVLKAATGLLEGIVNAKTFGVLLNKTLRGDFN